MGYPSTNKGGFRQKGVTDKKNKTFFANLDSKIAKVGTVPLVSSAAIGTLSTGNSYLDKIDEALGNHKQIVLTGAPGTGKTFSVREYVKSNIVDEEQCEFVQFHPSYDYSDFVEGLRPIDNSGSISFAKLDGTFKAFCRKIVEANLEYAYPSLSKDAAYNKIVNAISKNRNTDTSNEDEGIKRFSEGEKSYYFIIDEINRADLSKVFGELMFGLEESYRGIENRFKTQYSNLKTYEIGPTGASIMGFDCFKDGFFIPNNLYIIGTMNDIDRSVESFDFALRRRFHWVEIKANDVLKESLASMLSWSAKNSVEFDDLVNRIIAMNEKISISGSKYGLSEAYHIGHAYFKNVGLDAANKFDDDLRDIFETNIVSIIKEYMRGRKTDDVEQLIDECRTALWAYDYLGI